MTPAALAALAKGDIKNFAAAATPGGIEAQEKQGQIEQSFLETLPKDLGNQRPLFEKLGFVFGEDYDDLFVNAKFPKGWRKQTTDHAMSTHLVDEQGRIRGSIFYKAAFYDRKADAHLMRRFSVQSDYGKTDQTLFVYDEGVKSRVFQCDPEPNPDWSDREQALKRSKAIDDAQKRCETWLNLHWKDWLSPSAYWDTK